MMPLWRREGFVEDKWAFLEDDAPAPGGGRCRGAAQALAY